MNPYLWDKSGEPDVELQGWERSLGRFSREAPALVLPPRLAPAPKRRYYWLAAAACVLLAASAGLRLAWQPGNEWRVVALAGTPLIDRSPVALRGRISVGGVLETDGVSSAKIPLGLMGAIEIEPNTRVRLVATGRGRHRIALDRGKIAARLWAPPGTLSVDTPSATAIDLGCAFTVQVGENGAGKLRVTSGWVVFEFNDRQSIVPAGAAALTRRGAGPGTPFFEDAGSAFLLALEQLDFGDASTLGVVLAEARTKDTISLLTLLRRLPPESRGAVFDRAAQLVPPPTGLTRQAAIAGTDTPGMDAWWKKLGLGDSKNWLVNWRDVFAAVR